MFFEKAVNINLSLLWLWKLVEVMFYLMYLLDVILNSTSYIQV